jgi:DMSO/TMAO reductase YedYZ heme-binding membrane subunit
MNPQLWWYVARASGLVAWGLAVSSVLWGLALSTKALGPRPRAAWLLDLHRFLGGLTVAFVAVHLGALVADSYVHVGLADLLVPMASSWKPAPVALGVIAFWFLVAIEVTSLFMRHLPRPMWRAVHLTSYVVAAAATVHGITAGTDAGSSLSVWCSLAGAGAVFFFVLYRRLGPRRAARNVRAARARAAEQPTEAAAIR